MGLMSTYLGGNSGYFWKEKIARPGYEFWGMSGGGRNHVREHDAAKSQASPSTFLTRVFRPLNTVFDQSGAMLI